MLYVIVHALPFEPGRGNVWHSFPMDRPSLVSPNHVAVACGGSETHGICELNGRLHIKSSQLPWSEWWCWHAIHIRSWIPRDGITVRTQLYNFISHLLNYSTQIKGSGHLPAENRLGLRQQDEKMHYRGSQLRVTLNRNCVTESLLYGQGFRAPWMYTIISVKLEHIRPW